tara:strand:- start:9303 stop:17198 length:7896 start_codon:yes stop_codon:yes gene_type:complete
MRKFKTPNGRVVSEDNLRQTYGVDFDEYLEDGTFQQVSNDSEEGPGEDEIIGSGEMYITPNGNEVTDIDLIEEYGSEKFSAFVNEGTFKKKSQSEDGGGNISPSESEGIKLSDPADANKIFEESEPSEEDYFTGAFGDVLRGIDSVSPIGIGDFIDDMARAVAGGVNQGIAGENASDLLLRGSMATDEDIASYLEANANAMKYGSSQEMQEYQKTYEENGSGFMGVVMGLAKSGLTILPELVLSSFASMASNTDSLAAAGTAIGTGATVGAVAGGGVLSAPGAVAGAAAALPYAFAAAGSALEMGATFSELLQEEIEGEMTPEKIREVLNDPEKYTSIRNKAIARGIVIGAIDAYTGKLGGKIATKVLTKSGTRAAKDVTKKQVMKSVLAAGGVEAVGGSVGEATARLAIGQELDVSEIALEGLAEIPGGVKDMVSTRFSKPKYKVNGERVDAETIDNLIETMTLAEIQEAKITIDNDYEGRAGKLQDRIVELSVEQSLLEANPNLNEATLNELKSLQIELDKLDGNKTEIAKEKAALIRQKIKELQATPLENEVQSEAAPVTNKEVMDRMEEISPGKGVYTTAEFNNVKALIEKERADAAAQGNTTQEVAEFDSLSEAEKTNYLEQAGGDESAARILYDKDKEGDNIIFDNMSTKQKLDDEDPNPEVDVEGNPRFSLKDQDEALVTADESDVEAIAEEMNSMEEAEVNFTSPSVSSKTQVNPSTESNSTTPFTEADAQALDFESLDDMNREMSYYDGIPMVTGISDILTSGTVNDSRGNSMDVDGGLGFNSRGKNKEAAWAGVDISKSQAQYDGAVKTYQKNKALFDRLWSEGKLPDGHIPMAIIKMGNEAINSNEAVFRYMAPEIKAQSKENQTNAMNDIVARLKEQTSNKGGAGTRAQNILDFIAKKKITTLGNFMDAITVNAKERAKGDKSTLSLDERALIYNSMVSKEGVKKASKPFITSLFAGVKNPNTSLFTSDVIYNALGDPSMLKSNKGDVVAITGIDVKNGGIIDIDHNNYGTGPKGRLISFIKNPTNGIDVFPTWKAKTNRIFKKDKAGKTPNQKTVAGQTMGTAANDKAFQGAVVDTKMSDIQILAGKLRFAFPGVSVSNTIQEFNSIVNQPGVRTKESNGKIILGLTKDGKVFLNPEAATLNTPIHEFGHIWIDFLRSKASKAKGTKLLARGLKLVEGTPELQAAIEKYGDTKLAREEALVELMAAKGETIINAAKKSKFKEWMNATFKYIQQTMKGTKELFKKDSGVDIDNLTLEEFTDAGLADLFGGFELSADFNAQEAANNTQPRFSLSDEVGGIVNSLIETAKAKALKANKKLKSIPKSIMDVVNASESYKKADDIQKENILRDIRKQLGIRETRTTTSVRKYLGIKSPKKITLNEKQGLIKQLRDLNRGAKTAKAAFVRASQLLTKEIKQMVKDGKISASQMADVLRKFSTVNMFNPTSVERFVDYMAKVFNDSDYANKISIANSKRKTALNNIARKIGISDMVKPQLAKLFSINPSMIPDSVLDKYMKLVEVFGKKEGVLTLPEISEMTKDVDAILRQLDEEQSMAISLKDRFDNSEKITDDDGKVSYAATLKAMLDEGQITDREFEVMKKYKAEIMPKTDGSVTESKAEAEVARQANLDELSKKDIVNANELPSREERNLANRLRKLLDSPGVQELSNADIKNLLKLIDNINNGYLPHFAQLMVEKIEANNNSQKGAAAIKRSKLLPITKMYSRLKSILTRKKSIDEMVRRNPLFYIDQLFGDFKTRDIFNAVFGKTAEAVASFRSNLKGIQGRIEQVENAVMKSFGRDNNKFVMSKYKQMAYMIQLEFESNPNNKEVNDVSGFLEATIKRIREGTSRYSEADAVMLEEILKTYSVDGKFNNEALYETFNEAEKNSIKVLQDINKEMGPLASYTANVIRGEGITPRANYVHLNVINDTSEGDVMGTPNFAQEVNDALRPSTRAKSLVGRTGKVSPLNFDVYASVQRGSKYVLMDYHLTEPIRTARRTLNRMESKLQPMSKQQQEIFNAVRNAFEEATDNLITNSYTQNSIADEVFNYLQKQGYRSILAGTGRFIAELTSNLSFALIVDPKGFIAGTKLMKMFNSEKGPSIMNNLKSKQQNRLYPSDNLSGKMVDTNILSQVSGVKGGKASKNKVTNFISKLWNQSGQRWIKGVEFTADALISTPDKLIMKPMWFGAFSEKFKEITGVEPDFDKIAANDSAYMEKFSDALAESTELADTRSVMAGATDNAFMGLLKGTNKPNMSGSLRAFNAFNGFMTRFLIFEYVTARTGIVNMIGRGELSKRQGAALIAGVTSRMMLYTLVGTMLSEAMTDLFDDEEEEGGIQKLSTTQMPSEPEDDSKSFDKRLGQSFASAFTSLLFGRDFGNATKTVINYAIEDFNEKQLQFLRDGEYDAFKDGIQYNIVPKGKQGRGSGLADFLMKMGAAYGPILGTADLLVKKLTEPDRKESDAIDRQNDERYVRLPMEILGNLGFIPLYKDVRKIVLSQMYGDLSRAEAEIKNKKKTKIEMLQGYDSESDMKRYNRTLWERTFGEDSPGYDERAALKAIKKAKRDLRQQQKDELYNYTPKTKRRSSSGSGFNATGRSTSTGIFSKKKKNDSPFNSSNKKKKNSFN